MFQHGSSHPLPLPLHSWPSGRAKHTPGTAQQTAPRGSRAEQRALQPCEKPVLEKGVHPKAVPVRGLKKAPGKQNKSQDNEASMVLPCVSRAPCVRGFPYMFWQEENMGLVYKNYRLASEFNPCPLSSSPSLGAALCRASCFSRLRRREQLKISHSAAICFCLPGFQGKVRALQRAAGLSDCIIPILASKPRLLFLRPSCSQG